jgi:hypothetical protein
MSLMATAFGTKVAIAALSLVAIGGGTAVAASALPSSGTPDTVQTDTATATATPAADDTETATPDPTADPSESPEPTPSASATRGPDATGPAAFGLCTAFTAGGLHSTSVAHAALLSASQSAGSIAAYCAPVLAAHGHVPTSDPTPTLTVPTTPGRSGTAHDHGAPGSHGH